MSRADVDQALRLLGVKQEEFADVCDVYIGPGEVVVMKMVRGESGHILIAGGDALKVAGISTILSSHPRADVPVYVPRPATSAHMCVCSHIRVDHAGSFYAGCIACDCDRYVPRMDESVNLIGDNPLRR